MIYDLLDKYSLSCNNLHVSISVSFTQHTEGGAGGAKLWRVNLIRLSCFFVAVVVVVAFWLMFFFF